MVITNLIDLVNVDLSFARDEVITVEGINSGSTSSYSQNAFAELKNATLARRALGRFQLEEAALLIARNANERPMEMLRKLSEAVESGLLRVYEPGRNAEYRPLRIRQFYEEAYWNDLNTWLINYEDRIVFRFQDPELGNIGQDTSPPKSRQAYQEEQIIKVIKELGYDPLNLPNYKPGKAGVKSEVRAILGYSHSVLNKAWERLLAYKDILYKG
jgi:hypothetical protein